MHTREAPDFWGLHKNMNCAFPLKLNVNFLCFYVFREENLLIDFLGQNTHKMTHKVFTKHSQNASKNVYPVRVLNLNLR